MPARTIPNGGILQKKMPSRSQRPAIKIWPRKYYTSPTKEHREAIRLHNYRCFFLKSIENCTPEVVDDLAYYIQPRYAKEFWADCEQAGPTHTMFDNFVKYHQHYAHSWFLGSRDFWWDRYATVREELLAWAQYYKPQAEWVLKMALDAMGEWTQHFTHFEKFETVLPQAVIEERAKRISPDLQSQYLEEMRAHAERVNNAVISWPARPYTPANSIYKPDSQSDLKTFQYPKWDGYDESSYERSIRSLFESHLEECMREVRDLASRATPVEIMTKPERFDMLALYLCRDKKLEEIAAMKLGGVRKDKTGVSKDIGEAAELVKISLKTRGIPRGTKLQRRPC